MKVFLVGGSVRDALLGLRPADLDFATDLRPEEIIAALKRHGLPAIPVGMAFGTVATVLNGQKVEITTFRCKESYPKGSRRPQVVFGKTIEDDLRRRDFTINAMALSSDGKIIDPFGGRADLGRRVLRTPADPAQAFLDDPLRILRAARFVGKLNMTPALDLVRAAVSCKETVRQLSGERVREEMTKILLTADVGKALQFLADTGVLATLFPAVADVLAAKGMSQGRHHSKDIWQHTTAVVEAVPAVPALRWAALFHDVGKPPTRSVVDGDVHFLGHEEVGASIFEAQTSWLHWSNADKNRIVHLIRNHMVLNNYASAWTDRAVRRLVRTHGDYLPDMFALSRADITSHNPAVVAGRLALLDELERRAANQPEVAGPLLPKGIGNTLMAAFGLEPGKEVGRLKEALAGAVVDGELPPNGPPEIYVKYLIERIR